MLSLFRRNPVAMVLSIMLHLLLIYLLIRSADQLLTTDSAAPVVSEDAPVIEVEIPEETVSEVMQELREKRQKQKEDIVGLKKKEDAALKALREAKEEEDRRLAELKRQREEEQKRIKREKELEQQRLADLKRQQEEAEQKKKEEEARLKKLEEERIAAEKKAEEQRIIEEERRIAEEAEKKAKAEAEKRRKAEEAKKLAEKRKKEKELAARKKAEAAAANQKRNSTGGGAGTTRQSGGGGGKNYNKYIAQIRSKIQRNWRRPLGAEVGLTAKLRLTLFPGGGIADVQVIQSSGDVAFDRSAEDAARRSDPLPVPSGKDFDQFRSFVLKFTPDRIR